MEPTNAQKVLTKYGNIEISMLYDADKDGNSHLATGKILGADAFKFALLEINAILEVLSNLTQTEEIVAEKIRIRHIEWDILNMYYKLFNTEFTW